MLFSRFANEAEFRDFFVKPLLTRMGFHGVAQLHGTQEFGKDFVFSELTRFGFLRHYAAQVKHEERITQSQHAKLSEILSQIRQAFSVKYAVPDSNERRSVSAVFLFSSGEITANAKTALAAEFEKERYGQNVHIFDSDRLEAINGFNSFHREETLKPVLLGLHNQLWLNVKIWQSMIESLPSFNEARGPLLAAVESYLSMPLMDQRIDINEVMQLWQKARIIDAINHRYISGGIVLQTQRESDIEVIRKLGQECIDHAKLIMASCLECNNLFKPL